MIYESRVIQYVHPTTNQLVREVCNNNVLTLTPEEYKVISDEQNKDPTD